MFQSLVDFLSGIPFFQSATYGILAMVIVGASWCITGLVFGSAPKRGVEPCLIQLFCAVAGITLDVVTLVVTAAYSTSSPMATTLALLSYFLGGLLNFYAMQYMSNAMQLGPNGIVWAIVQSAMIFPFIVGIMFYDVVCTPMRIVGILCILLALGLFAFKGDNSNNSAGWKKQALIALLFTIVVHNVCTFPSYYQSARGVTSVLRHLASCAGAVAASFIYICSHLTPRYKQQFRSNLTNWTLWKYILVMQGTSIILAYTLMYPGMNTMADHGLGGMCYPTMVAACLFSFTITSLTVLKERFGALQIAGLAACLCGITMLCIPV